MTHDAARIIERDDFGRLLEVLRDRGFTVVGPTVRDQAIVYEELDGVEDLPVGWTDEHDRGHYRLRRRNDQALFGYVVGPHSWKKFVHPPHLKLFSARRDDNGIVSFDNAEEKPLPRYAMLGIRSCDLHALGTLDKVFRGKGFTDPDYAGRRDRVFIVALNCGVAGGTCFCVSMDTGPKVHGDTPHDLALTEILDGNSHFFVARAGSDRGADVLAELRTRPATPEDVRAADERVAATAEHMGRRMDPAGIKELLYDNVEHPHWDDVARRCLSCANCTLVCPTCFCTTVEDLTDITGQHAERWRRWDSCFTMDFTHLHGGSVRQSAKSRYRQWLTHKLATWYDQFGSSGCVGCGRCISWCPVGIDLTDEIAALRDSPGSNLASSP